MRSTGLVNWHITDLSHSYNAAGYARHRLPPSEIARARRTREQRSVPFAAAANALEDGAEPALDPDRFLVAQGTTLQGTGGRFPSPGSTNQRGGSRQERHST